MKNTPHGWVCFRPNGRSEDTVGWYVTTPDGSASASSAMAMAGREENDVKVL
jgi:hypothetical protein